ncbi:MAG: tRNA (guanosine(46)-N7)-methyltransferase TrmB [Deltaproteobacteria bacterium]|nr:MAG: tRNA (guanosine(46)-N7)-methyltransferase TrmB [Deltaproteobacteria bacterium]
MPHLYTTKPKTFPSEHWKHDRKPVELIRLSTSERPYFVKIRHIHENLFRLSLLVTPIDLILNRHKQLLLDVAKQLDVEILKSNLGNRLKPDIGTEYLWDETGLRSLPWASPEEKVFEIGSGNGAFLCKHAITHPEKRYIGTEINGFTLRKALRKAARARLDNIHFIRNDAQYILRYHVPDKSLQKIYINFPDPWEKKRYQKRRLIQPETLHNFARTLKPGGEVHFTTDHRDYAEHTTQQFSETPYFRLMEKTTDAALPFPTKYENKWRSEGRRIIQLVFLRTEHPLTVSENVDGLFPASFEIATDKTFSSEETFKAENFVWVLKDVYKGTRGDILDTVLSYGRYKWNVLFLKESHRLLYDSHLNRKYLTRKIKAYIETLLEAERRH